MTAKAALNAFSLDDKYTVESGVALVTGIQALVRALQTRARLDEAAGLNSGGFVSGYRGSPLGGLDKELWSQAERLKSLGVEFQPGVNEDLAATAVWGSQQVGLHAGAKVDGVFGMWYGKAPGLDRSCDAIRHANAWGTSANGGVVLVVGDDPAAKSSSLATQSEFALQDMMVPVLFPSDVQDVHDFTVLGWAMSRHSGMWVGLKAIADHMDSAATIEVADGRFPELNLPETGEVHIRVEDTPVAQEHRLLADKLPRVLDFARAAGLNRWVTERHNASGSRSRLGIITAGKAYRDVREACAQLGLHSTADIRDAGIEILKLGMTWPLDPELIERFSANVDELFVVEEKRAFVEPQIKEILYGAARRLPVYGKARPDGSFLLPSTGLLNVTDITSVLVDLLDLQAPAVLERLARTEAVTSTIDAPAKKERTPLFCAGCPHNTSTRVPDGSRATAGIGCHYMVQWMDRSTDSCTQMGGEGITWVGEAPFTEEQHIFANLGDGTYFHSGILAIRQAVAAGVNITYKVLFNDAVAMTGGQPTDGELTVADLVAQVQAEGVRRIAIVSDDPAQHTALVGNGVTLDHRGDLDDVQKTLREETGVSVIVYQQTCATELRRRRKRGMIEDNKPRLFINEAVCEGCGDCSLQSNCVAVEPVETEFGLKRKINQTNCNKDLSCATGFCPAFVEVQGDVRRASGQSLDVAALREKAPLPAFKRDHANVLITGVGGTGIVTLSALLAAAARIEGKQVRTLDMTGLAQKGGAVFAHVRIADAGDELHSPRIPDASADVLVGCDLVSAASDEALELFSDATQAVVNSHVTPTADFVLSQSHDVKLRKRISRINKLAGELQSFAAEDHIEALLGDAQQANVMLLGYAYQLGGIPLALDAIEAAIEVNGVAVERNLTAFHLGRIAAWNIDALPRHDKAPRDLSAKAAAPESLPALIEHRSRHLEAYDGERLVTRYREMLAKVADVEQALRPGSEQLTRAVAVTYAQLLAVKDEYEVARLHANPAFQAELAGQFEPGAKINYLLAPPLLGTKKRRFGRWMTWGFKTLAAMKGLRNTPLDPFAHTGERKQAKFLIEHFETMIDEILPLLTISNLSIAVALAKCPQQVRGYGHVKARHLEQALREEARLMAEFTTPPEPVRLFDPAEVEAA